MSTDRSSEILNYLSAMSRDVGEFRQEFRQFREETNTRLEKIEQRLEKVEREQRQTVQFINRVAGSLLMFRSDIDELQDRVTGLEGKRA